MSSLCVMVNSILCPSPGGNLPAASGMLVVHWMKLQANISMPASRHASAKRKPPKRMGEVLLQESSGADVICSCSTNRAGRHVVQMIAICTQQGQRNWPNTLDSCGGLADHRSRFAARAGHNFPAKRGKGRLAPHSHTCHPDRGSSRVDQCLHSTPLPFVRGAHLVLRLSHSSRVSCATCPVAMKRSIAVMDCRDFPVKRKLRPCKASHGDRYGRCAAPFQ